MLKLLCKVQKYREKLKYSINKSGERMIFNSKTAKVKNKGLTKFVKCGNIEINKN